MSETRSFADRSLVQLTLVRFREFLREPEAIFWVFVFPVLLAGGLGLAFQNRPADILKIAATDGKTAAVLRPDKNLEVAVMDRSAGDVALRTGRIVLLAISGPDGLKYRYDDTNPDARTARLLVDRAVRLSAGAPDPVKTSDDLVREPGSRYIDFVIPGLLGMNLMGSGIWGLGFTIVDSRRKKLLKRLVASPMPKWEFLLSFLLSRLTMLIFEVLALLLFAKFLFGVPLRGPLWELAFLCLFGSLAFSALGLLIASRVRTIEAASGLMNLVMLPMWVLSGVFFSAERFPDFLQPFIRALPLTAVIDALRSNMLQGARLTEMSWQVPVIGVWLVGSFVLALKLFRWR
jgi:ABC-type polysaccharide/polyol phosphate export permease